MILTVTPNPCVDKTVFIDGLKAGTFIHANDCSCVPGGKGNNVARAVKTMGRAAKATISSSGIVFVPKVSILTEVGSATPMA